MRVFDEYTKLSGSIAMRILCDNIRDTTMLKHAIGMHETIPSFVGYLRTLDPAKADFWQQVYQRLDLVYPADPEWHSKENSAMVGKKAWWRFW